MSSTFSLFWYFRDDAENTVVVGTADGHVTLIPLSYFKDGSKVV